MSIRKTNFISDIRTRKPSRPIFHLDNSVIQAVRFYLRRVLVATWSGKAARPLAVIVQAHRREGEQGWDGKGQGCSASRMEVAEEELGARRK